MDRRSASDHRFRMTAGVSAIAEFTIGMDETRKRCVLDCIQSSAYALGTYSS
jgi:hypothetical protein